MRTTHALLVPRLHTRTIVLTVTTTFNRLAAPLMQPTGQSLRQRGTQILSVTRRVVADPHYPENHAAGLASICQDGGVDKG